MGKGRGTVFTRIQKIKRKDNKILKECHICKNCTDRNICNNRNDCNKCDKCKNCKEHDDCDKFYFYKRTVGEYRASTNKVGKTIYGKKKSDVTKEVTLKIAEVHKGIHVDSSKVTLKELMQTVVNNRLLNGQTKERAYKRNLETIKTAEKMDILNMCIQDISNTDIIKSFSKIRVYSQSTIDKIFSLTNSAFKTAIIEKILYTNPLDNKDAIKKPKSQKNTKIVRSFTIEEQKAFVKRTYLEEKYGIMFRIDLATGLRPGELLALKPSDYNSKKEVLYIRRTLTKDKEDNLIIGGTTKTNNGDREIPVTNEFKEDLLTAIKNMRNNENNLIFVHENGKMINPITFNHVFKRVCKNINIENVTAYTMRHSFATRRLESHMDVKLLAELMGHSDIETIYKNYVMILDDFKYSELKRYYRYAETVGLYKSKESKESIEEIINVIKNLYIEDPNKLIKKLSTVKIL